MVLLLILRLAVGGELYPFGNKEFSACTAAIAKGIVVNTIHCGSREEGAQTGWQEGALLAFGSYSIIDQHRKVEHREAPQDSEIARLGLELNKTYVPYGAEGWDGQARQTAQDKNAEQSGAGGATQRAVTKANRHY